ncbi:MAG: MFS transporter [Gammaproteobacteria bacterium]|nr:MAG: MFS transporter [Gammaproteobacteria bacterium]
MTASPASPLPALPEASLGAALRSTWPLLLGLALIMLGAGLQGTLLGLRATLEGFPTIATGLMMSAYYLGFLVGSLTTSRLVAKVGHIRVFAALASLASMTILVHSVAVDVYAWVVLRVLSGICFAGIYIVAESWLNDRASNQTRGRIFAVYMMINFGGLAAGQFLLNLADPQLPALFMLVSVLVSLAAVPLVLSSRQGPSFARASALPLPAIYQRSPMAVVGVIAAGLASGAIFGMTAVYAATAGLSVAQTASLVAMPILGAMLLQWPLGLLSDRIDRRRVVSLAAGLALLAALATLWVAVGSPLFYLAMLLLGGATLPVHGIAASHLNDQLALDQMVAASSTLILLSGAGAAAGPLLVALLMGTLGGAGFLWFFLLVSLLLLVFSVWRIFLHVGPDEDSKRPWVATRPAVSPVAVEMAAEAQVEAAEAAESDHPPQSRPPA